MVVVSYHLIDKVINLSGSNNQYILYIHIMVKYNQLILLLFKMFKYISKLISMVY